MIFPIHSDHRDLTTGDRTWGLREAPPGHGQWSGHGQGCRWRARDRRGDRISNTQTTVIRVRKGKNCAGIVVRAEGRTHLIVDESSEGEEIKEIGEEAPDVGIAVFSQTFVVEAIDLCDLP